MAYKELFVALSMIVTASPLSASQSDQPPATPAPAGTPETKYCLRVDPLPGQLAQTVQCWTRAEWADQDVDVDKVWATDGVRTVG